MFSKSSYPSIVSKVFKWPFSGFPSSPEVSGIAVSRHRLSWLYVWTQSLRLWIQTYHGYKSSHSYMMIWFKIWDMNTSPDDTWCFYLSTSLTIWFDIHCISIWLRQTNLEVCLRLIGERGYACQSYLLDASWYGLPQSRRRVYIVCLASQRPEVSVSASDFFASVKTLLQAMRFEPPPADFWSESKTMTMTITFQIFFYLWMCFLGMLFDSWWFSWLMTHVVFLPFSLRT